MKRKTVITLVAVLVILLLGGLYFFYQNNILEDEALNYERYFVNLGLQEFRDENSIESINITNFNTENCTIDYCILNNCNNAITLPCSKEQGNEFEGGGFYKVNLNFSNYLLFPFSGKEKLVSWAITKNSADLGSLDAESYLLGIKEILKDHYVWETLSVYVNDKTKEPDSWVYNSDFKLSHRYLKSIYLLNELSIKHEDSELEGFVTREIDYINSKKEELISKQYPYPFSYILELIDLGLDNDFVELYNQNSYLRTNEIEFNPNYEINSTIGSVQELEGPFNQLIFFAENSVIFNKFGYEDLSNYFYYKMVELYNSYDFGVLGLCSVSNLGFEEVDKKLLLDNLEELYSDESRIKSNIYEIAQCNSFIQNEDSDTGVLADSINEVIINSTVKIREASYFLDIYSVLEEDDLLEGIIIKYKLLPNLIYLNEK
jgi:hypothetical protein